MNKYLERNKMYIHLEPTKEAKKVYIFCEGNKREVDYFRFFDQLSSNISIIAIPSESGKTDPEKLMKQADDYFDFRADALDYAQGDEVWFVIDTDQWNEGNKIEHLQNFCIKKNFSLTSEAWKVAQSNPSFEIWLYYHFFDKKPIEEIRNLKQFVDSKIPGGFDSRKHPIEIKEAIVNSENNYEEENSQPTLYSTAVYKLGKVIMPFVREVLDKKIQKVKL